MDQPDSAAVQLACVLAVLHASAGNGLNGVTS